MSEEAPQAEIKIAITPGTVTWETELSEVEVIFWIECVKNMIFQRAFNSEDES